MTSWSPARGVRSHTAVLVLFLFLFQINCSFGKLSIELFWPVNSVPSFHQVIPRSSGRVVRQCKKVLSLERCPDIAHSCQPPLDLIFHEEQTAFWKFMLLSNVCSAHVLKDYPHSSVPCGQIQYWMRLCHSSLPSAPHLCSWVLDPNSPSETRKIAVGSLNPLPSLSFHFHRNVAALYCHNGHFLVLHMGFSETASSHNMCYTWRIQVSFSGYKVTTFISVFIKLHMFYRVFQNGSLHL